jgi:hypothetical protein
VELQCPLALPNLPVVAHRRIIMPRMPGNERQSVDGVRPAESTAECERFGLPARPRRISFSRMFSLSAVVCAPFLTRAQFLVQAPGLGRWQCELRLGVTVGQGMEMGTEF